MAIEVPKIVFDGIHAVRNSGATNMLDRPRVIEIMRSMGEDEAADWVEHHKSEYSHGIFQGFKAVENAEPSQGGEA